MKVTFAAAILGLANIVASQLDLPECAKNCVTKATSGSNIGNCNGVDIVCICSSSTFLSSIACCLASVCSTADQEKAVSEARDFCGISGVTNLPTAVVCASTAPASTSGGSSTASGASTTGSSASGASTTGPSQVSSASSAAASAASTSPTSGAQKVIGAGAGVLGGLAMGVALL